MTNRNKSIDNGFILKASVALICTVGTQLAHADVATAQKWLSLQTSNGSTIANPLQTYQEVSSTLSNLKFSNALETLTTTLDNETSTEGLVRLILIAKANQQSLPQAWQTLALNQNEDGGFGHIEGWQSNPLDTAYTLIALQESGYLETLDATAKAQWQTKISKALYYLATQQQADGSYKIAYLDDLYINSYVLSSITPYLKQYGRYLPVAQKLVNYLQSKQTATSTWSTRTNNSGLFIDALVAESLYPYQTSQTAESFKNNFTNRVLALQNSDGSWQGDAYVTAVVLRSLDNLTKPVANPTTAGVSLSVIDAETSIALSDVVLTADGLEVNSDSIGNITVNDAKAGKYQFTLTRAGYASVNFTVTLQQGEQLNLGQVRLSRSALVTTGQIQGTVKDKTTQAPIVSATVTVVLVDDAGQKLTKFDPIIATTDAKGRYQVVLSQAQLDASKGKFGIHVGYTGYNAVAANGTVQAGGVAMFSPSLTSLAAFNASLIGKVVDSAGQPLAGATLNYQGNPVATTDSTGSFVINNLPMGSGQWQIQLAGYQSSLLSLVVDQSIAYNAGTITLPKVQLTDPNNPNSPPVAATQGTIIVAPTDSQTKKPLANFSVKFELLDSNNAVIQTQSFAPNKDQLNQISATLPIGKWRVTISQPSYQSVSQLVDLADKASQTYNPAMVLSPYAITSTVVDSITNQPIANAPVKIINSSTQAVIFTGTTNANGQFTTPSTLAANTVQVEINPSLYLPTTRYLNRDYDSTSTIDMGEIRLRPKLAEVVLPDLVISKTNTNRLKTDQQTLGVSGDLSVSISNKGNADLTAKPVKVTAFIDSNHNRKLDADELVIGSTTVDMALIQAGSMDVTIPVSGKLNFKDAPIAVMVDSDGQVAESNENNNVTLTSDAVQIKPTAGMLDPIEIWHWNGQNSSYPQYNQVMVTPVVAPLIDTNKDNKIDKTDKKFVIFTSYYAWSYYSGNGVLRILDASTGQEVKSFGATESGNYSPFPVGHTAVVDINKDGEVEILVATQTGINCYTLNQGFLWHIDLPNYSASASINFYDIDNDENPEIIVGENIIDNEGHLVHAAVNNVAESYPFYFNGKNYLLSNNHLIDLSIYQIVSTYTANQSGFISSAILNTDADNEPEIAIKSVEGLALYKLNGNKIWGPIKPGNSGSPTVADMNNDGKPEIGMAYGGEYTAFRSDGSLLWSIPTQDYSSQATGSTVFDFENDGKSEVLYADEVMFRIINGENGTIKYKVNNTSGTLRELPVVVDGDGDGHADIYLISNDLAGNFSPIRSGIKMLSSASKTWADTRHIWNEANYHITNINDDMTVPTTEKPSWLDTNTYRLNTIPNVNTTAAIDLTTSYIQVKDNGSNGPSQFTARIGNAGGKTAPKGTPVSFYQKDSTGQSKLLGIVKIPKELATDEYIDLSLDYSPLTGTLNGFGELIVIANDAGAGIDSATGIPNPTDPTKPVNNQGVVQEYSRANNIATLGVTGNFAGFSLAGNLDKTSYTANETVKITSIATNLGSFETNSTLKVSIIDSAGNVVVTYPEQSVKLGVAIAGQPMGSDNSTTVQNFWNTEQQRTGNYTAHLELMYNNKTVASVDKPFALVADGVMAGQVNSQLAVDKTQYNTTDLVQIHSRLINTASNAMATARNIALTVKDPTGQVIWTQNYSQNEFAPNALKEQYFTVPLNNAKVGQYSVTSVTTAPDGSQSSQTLQKGFEVLSAAQTGINITGTINAPEKAEIDTNVQLNWLIKNDNAQNLSNIPLSIALYQGESDTPFTTISVPSQSINANGQISGVSDWLVKGNDGDKITAVLVGTFGNTQKTLGMTSFTLSEAKVQASLPAQPKADTLLVYYACEDGWYTSLNNSGAGNFNYPCFNEREATIRSYLDRMGVNYKLVKTPWDFRHEMQSGMYGQYWLLGAIENLSPHTYNEIVEMTNTGQNILFDSGTHSWLNQDLYKLANVKYNGRLLLETGEINPNPYYFPVPTDPQLANSKISTLTKLAGQPFNSNWAIILEPKSSNVQSLATFSGSPKQIGGLNQANYPNQTYNAMTAATYGNGVPVVASFDMISSLDFAQKSTLPPYQNNANVMQLRWDVILGQLLQSRTIKARSDYAPSEPVRIPVNLTNDANSERRIQVDIKLPTGSSWLGYQGGVNTAPSTTLEQHYQITLKPKQSLQDVLAVRLPATSGTHNVLISVNDITNTTSPKLVQQLEARFLVRDINSRLAMVKQAIDQWQVAGVNGVQVMNAKTKLSLIQTHLNTGVDELAVYEAGNLAHILSDMQTTPEQNPVPVRYETDELLRALQIKWYLARSGKPPLP